MEKEKQLMELLLKMEVNSNIGYFAVRFMRRLRTFFKYSLYSDKSLIEKKFKETFGRKLNWSNPQTLNEKIQWLKLNDRKDYYTQCADKYAVRELLKTEFGEEYLIPLVFATDNWKEMNESNINQFPCIVKANHTSGNYLILRNSSEVDWKKLQLECRRWLDRDFFVSSREWQYKNIKRKIVVERLLETKEGRIPNDYKLHYMNGELQIVYVSVDREGKNKRNIYDQDWKPLYFSWAKKHKDAQTLRGDEIEPPATFGMMKEIGKAIARKFKYVRVDFYDVDGKLYFGEITLHHGSGFDVFTPEEYDLKYGRLLKL